MNRFAREVDDFVDGITDALAGRLNEKIIPYKQIKEALKSLQTKIGGQEGELGIDSIRDLLR